MKYKLNQPVNKYIEWLLDEELTKQLKEFKEQTKKENEDYGKTENNITIE